MNNALEYDLRYGIPTEAETYEAQQAEREYWQIATAEEVRSQAVASVADEGPETEPEGGWVF